MTHWNNPVAKNLEFLVELYKDMGSEWFLVKDLDDKYGDGRSVSGKLRSITTGRKPVLERKKSTKTRKDVYEYKFTATGINWLKETMEAQGRTLLNYPFTRLGMRDSEVEELKRCLNMGMSEGEEYPICHTIMNLLENGGYFGR